MKYLQNKKIQASVVLLVVDILFFGLFNPQNAASPLLFIGFLLLGISSSILWYLLLRVSRILIGRPKQGLRRMTIALTVATIVLIALQSIGQLTARDGLVIVALCIIFWFYGSYYRRKQM